MAVHNDCFLGRLAQNQIDDHEDERKREIEAESHFDEYQFDNLFYRMDFLLEHVCAFNYDNMGLEGFILIDGADGFCMPIFHYIKC